MMDCDSQTPKKLNDAKTINGDPKAEQARFVAEAYHMSSRGGAKPPSPFFWANIENLEENFSFW